MNTLVQRLPFLAFALLLFTAVTVHGKEKDRAWKTGKVLDSNEVSHYAGSTAATSTDYGNGVVIHSGSNAIYRVNQVYVIELGEYVYVAQERLRWRWSKPADLTVNGPVKVAIEKKKLYLMDDDGKEHEAEITKKILKEK